MLTLESIRKTLVKISLLAVAAVIGLSCTTGCVHDDHHRDHDHDFDRHDEHHEYHEHDHH